jgi:hypothetical protein
MRVRVSVKPFAAVVDRLRDAARTGVLPEFNDKLWTILEIRALTGSYNRAAVAVRETGEQLEADYLEFVGSLANALDARDRAQREHAGDSTGYHAELLARTAGLASYGRRTVAIAPPIQLPRFGVKSNTSLKVGGRYTRDWVISCQTRLFARPFSAGISHFPGFPALFSTGEGTIWEHCWSPSSRLPTSKN